MTKVAFIGSFNNFHKGHQHILKRAAKIFDYVYVVVLNNDAKKNSGTLNERHITTKSSVEKMNIKNTEVVKHSGLTVEILRKLELTIILRGLRNTTDFLYEQELENIYKNKMPSLEIVYLFDELKNDEK